MRRSILTVSQRRFSLNKAALEFLVGKFRFTVFDYSKKKFGSILAHLIVGNINAADRRIVHFIEIHLVQEDMANSLRDGKACF